MKSGTSDERDLNVESDGEDESSSISDILGTSMSIGRHSFSQMEADVDKQRHARRQSDQLTMAAEQHRIQ